MALTEMAVVATLPTECGRHLGEIPLISVDD
jgi:formylmethanofuran dehydrogenase subunit B